MTTFQRRCIILYALIATPLSGACVDIYVPSLPGITQHFSTTQALVQLSISIYLLGYALVQHPLPITAHQSVRSVGCALILGSPSISMINFVVIAYLPNVVLNKIHEQIRTLSPQISFCIN